MEKRDFKLSMHPLHGIFNRMANQVSMGVRLPYKRDLVSAIVAFTALLLVPAVVKWFFL